MSFETLRPRVMTAGVMVGVFLILEVLSQLGCVGRILYSLAGLILSCAAAYEIAQIVTKERAGVPRLGAVILPLVLPAGCTFVRGVFGSVCEGGSLEAIFPVLGVSLVVSLLLVSAWMMGEAREDLSKGGDFSRDLFPMTLLVGGGGGALVALSLLNSHAALFWVVLIVALNDTAAYFVGSAVGGPKLAPAISPNKTVSGSLAGLGAGIVAAAMTSSISGLPGGWISVGVSGLWIIAGAQMADLLKSFLKRTYGVKDTGTILPGHGGILDRIDGVLGGSLVYLLIVVLGW